MTAVNSDVRLIQLSIAGNGADPTKPKSVKAKVLRMQKKAQKQGGVESAPQQVKNSFLITDSL